MRLPIFSAVRNSTFQTTRGVRYLHTAKGTTPQALKAQGPARTRFAPSPTGDLHLGSLRTALFNYLIAKATGGQFLLRLEDTDQKRTVTGAEERLYNDLKWAGIEWDEGPLIGGPYGPYRQSERTELYRAHAGQLLESGNAYRCFCSAERLHTLAEHKSKLGLPADYDRTCAHIPKEQSDDRASKGESHVVRLKVPAKYPVFEDLVYGIVKQRKPPISKLPKTQSFDDPILLKTDGFPTYHLANVVDDHLMKITHVVRGSEWMSSTPKHLAMYQAFGWSPPQFAHVGLLVDAKKQKLSKRTGSIDIASYRNNGVFPETLTNFVALLGWSHYEKSDVMSLEELVQKFSLKFTTGDATVSFEKLAFLQRRHATRYAGTNHYPPNPEGLESLNDLALHPILSELARTELDTSFFKSIPEGEPQQEYVRAILFADIANYTFPSNFIERNNYFFTAPTEEHLCAVPSWQSQFKLSNVPGPVTDELQTTFAAALLEKLRALPDETKAWTVENIKAAINNTADEHAERSIAALTPTHNEVTTSSDPVGQGEATPAMGDAAAASPKKSTMDPELMIKKAWKRLVLGYLRWALVCAKAGPETAATVKLLGREEALRRLERAEKVLREVGDGFGRTA